MKYNMLTVLHDDIGNNKFNQTLWVCRCDCGEVCISIASAVRNGHTKSCGCLQAAGNNRSHGQSHVNGGRRSRAYSSWCNMRNRCNSPANPHWKNYGGRGITVCKAWARFENFWHDMGEPPPDTTLDRIDNSKGYSKANCRWSDRVTQRRNSRSFVRWVEIEGQRMIVSDAVKKYKVVPLATVCSRIHNGWQPKDAVLTPFTRSDNKGYR